VQIITKTKTLHYEQSLSSDIRLSKKIDIKLAYIMSMILSRQFYD